jgi:hypothetical protein
MGKLTSKHIVEEIDNVRCTVVESGISLERTNFLKEILEINKLQVKIEIETKKEENASDTYKIGVTDIVFNPTIAIFERKLKNKEGISINPAFWNQETTVIRPYYWLRR